MSTIITSTIMIMKKLMIWAIVAIGTALMCVACMGIQKPQREAKADTTTVSREIVTNEDKQPVSTSLDVKSFGFIGPVKESFCIRYEVKSIDDDVLEKGEMSNDANDEAGYSFSEAGRVTGDAYGGVYNYDKTGKFVKGITAKSVMKRDGQGRVVFYQQKDDDEDDAMFTNEFTYDAKGRIIKVEQGFWEWTITQEFTYEGDNIYPSTRKFTRMDEGDESESETTYRYTKFDEVGNWIEREMTYRGSTREEGEVTRWRGANIEERRISYY